MRDTWPKPKQLFPIYKPGGIGLGPLGTTKPGSGLRDVKVRAGLGAPCLQLPNKMVFQTSHDIK